MPISINAAGDLSPKEDKLGDTCPRYQPVILAHWQLREPE